ncbi:MAG: hypothetical protein P8L91_08525 [Candidatus Marinimicrobia bacterium]|nr:hypothetical protein [Candidatus Neomarinimicrobiota bacterium]
MSELSEDSKLETQNYKVFSNVVFHYLCKKCGKFADRESGSNDYPHQCGISNRFPLKEPVKLPEKKLCRVYYTMTGKELLNWRKTSLQKVSNEQMRIDWENWELV